MSKRLYPSVFKEFRFIVSSVLLLVLLFSYNTSRAQVIVETFEGGSWGGLAATSGATIKSSYTNAIASSATAANQTITSWNGAAAASTTTVINGEPIASPYTWGYFSASTVSSTAASFSWARQLRSATHAITLASNSGYLITPVVSGGITTVTFWMTNGSGNSSTDVYVGLNTNTSNSTAYPTYAIGNSATTSQVGGVYTQFPLQTSYFIASSNAYPGSASSFSYSITGTNTSVPGQIVLFADKYNTGDYAIIDDITVYSAIPFTGTAQSIPGTIKPQNYDLGGQNYSYNDNDATNNGGAYRLGEGVDIENTTTGATYDGTNPYDIGWTNTGEWMDYTVNVATSGTYTLGVRVASPNSGTNTFDIRIDGTSVVGGGLSCPNTGGWQTWQTVTATTSSISAGLHKLRVYFTNLSGGGMNLNYLTLTSNSITTGTISGSSFCPGAQISVPYTITGTFGGSNVFTAQLSNSSGSFSSPTNIGTLTSASAGTISATLPTGITTQATGYLVRVIGSSPSITGSNSSSTLTIYAQPTPSFSVYPGTMTCAGISTTYTTQSGQSAYTWSVPGTVGTDYTITSGGIGTSSNTVTLTWLTGGSKTVTVNYQNSNNCPGANPASVTTTVSAPSISGTLSVCAGLTTTLTGSPTPASTNPWVSASTSYATVNSSGVVTGVAAGTSLITYTNNNNCTATATVTVNPVPMFSNGGQPSPASPTYYLNGSATPLSVTATGGTLTYQWYSNTSPTYPGTMITGATSSTYIPSTTTAGTTYYYVVVSNSNCSVNSIFSGAITVSGLNSAWLTGGNSGTTTGSFIGTTDPTPFQIFTNDQQRILIDNTGNVGIGTNTIPGYLLAVNGWAIFTKIKVEAYPNWPDYVFGNDYKLMPIAKLEKYIDKNKHLPGILSAEEIKKQGIDLSDNQAALLKKVEELTLYIIDQDKKAKDQDLQISGLSSEVKALQDQNKLMQSEIDQLKQLLQSK
jgi:carbohydrate binding protein with CBM6 domain